MYASGHSSKAERVQVKTVYLPGNVLSYRHWPHPGGGCRVHISFLLVIQKWSVKVLEVTGGTSQQTQYHVGQTVSVADAMCSSLTWRLSHSWQLSLKFWNQLLLVLDLLLEFLSVPLIVFSLFKKKRESPVKEILTFLKITLSVFITHR